MADVVVIPEVGAESEPAAERLEAAEAVAEAAGDVAETQAEAVVEVARIEAERDVQLAEIHTEADQAATEALAEALRDEELEQCRNRITSLEADNLSLSTELETLRASWTPPPEPSPPPPPDLAETPEDTSLRATEEGQAERPESPPSPEAAPPPPASPPPKPRRKFRWI